jgi:hypothetical protein
MSKGMKIARYVITIIVSLLCVLYILKIAGVRFFESLGDWILLLFRVLVATNMILILIAQKKTKSSEDS